MPVRIEALGRVCVGMERVRARRRRSVCVVALRPKSVRVYGLVKREEAEYPNGSPTTRKAMSTLSALERIKSELDSTISRSARIMGRP
jgi:hypothetical protein